MYLWPIVSLCVSLTFWLHDKAKLLFFFLLSFFMSHLFTSFVLNGDIRHQETNASRLLPLFYCLPLRLSSMNTLLRQALISSESQAAGWERLEAFTEASAATEASLASALTSLWPRVNHTQTPQALQHVSRLFPGSGAVCFRAEVLSSCWTGGFHHCFGDQICSNLDQQLTDSSLMGHTGQGRAGPGRWSRLCHRNWHMKSPQYILRQKNEALWKKNSKLWSSVNIFHRLLYDSMLES